MNLSNLRPQMIFIIKFKGMHDVADKIVKRVVLFVFITMKEIMSNIDSEDNSAKFLIIQYFAGFVISHSLHCYFQSNQIKSISSPSNSNVNTIFLFF